jgi:anti-sigma factor RsiW
VTERELDLDRAHTLMMAALDGECSDGDREELDIHLSTRPELAAEWVRLKRVKALTTSIEVAQPPAEAWDQFRRSAFHRTERSVAWVLIAAGGAVLSVAALWAWTTAWLASRPPLWIALAAGAVIAGFLVLIASIVRERWHLHRRDPYKEIVR